MPIARISYRCVGMLLALCCFVAPRMADADDADLILHHGQVITVDGDFTVAQAIAVSGDRLVRIGSNEEVLKLGGPKTRVVHLGGKTVLPGLIDSHTDPTATCMTEFDHPIPVMESIQDVLDYIEARAKALGESRWVVVRQVFITRLKEQRYPTLAELDRVAPRNPVLFATGPDASVNTLALARSGIDKGFKPEGPGRVERDPATGEPTGILRNLTRTVKVESPERSPSPREKDERLKELFRDYNAVGITAILDRDANAEGVAQFERLKDAGALSVRIGVSYGVDSAGPIDDVRGRIKAVADHPLRRPDSMLRIIGIKMYLDGGMLTGSAYMLRPWGGEQDLRD